MAKGKAWSKEQKESIIQSIEPYMKLGYSVNKACVLARIPSSTINQWMQEDEALRIKLESWKGMVSAKARENKVKEIQAGDGRSSEWWLEKMDSDFLPKKTIEHKGENVTVIHQLLSDASSEK